MVNNTELYSKVETLNNWSCINIGNIRSKNIKRIAKDVVINFYNILTTDFQENKRIVAEITNVSSKKQRNRIAGYVTTLMAQIRDSKIQTLEELV